MAELDALQGKESVFTYTQYASETIQKPCFNGYYGQAWQTVMGTAYDEQSDHLYYAKECQWPTYAPSDALQYIAAERGLERTVLVGLGTDEPEAQYRARLQQAWYIWNISGSQQSVNDEFYWMNFVNVQVLRRVDFVPNFAAGSEFVRTFARQVWSQFDVLIRKPNDVEGLIWGSFTWGAASTLWGLLNMTSADVSMMRRIVRNHKSAHDTCTYFILAFGGGNIWGAWTWGSGVWGGTAYGVPVICGEKWWFDSGLAA